MSKATKPKKTAEPSPPATNGTHVEDISHEVITDNSQSEKQSEKADIVPEKQIKTELAKFNLADAGIEQLKKDFGALVIAGTDDKAGYKAVREAWQLVRSKRTGLEKKGLEIRNAFKIITTAVSKEEDRLVALLEPLEEDLHKKWKAIDDEKERVKREAEEEEKRQLMARVEEVLAIGMTFKDGFYVCGETISMDVATLRALPVEQYDKLKKAVEAKAAEIAKAAQEAADQRQREADELQKSKDELKRQQDQLREQQDEMERQKRELQVQQQEARKLRYGNRVSQLISLGLTYNAQYDAMMFEDVNVDNKTEINLFSDEEWTALITKITPVIKQRIDTKAENERQKEEERQAIEAKKKDISEKMQAAGFSFVYTAQSFVWENDILALAVPMLELVPMNDIELALKIETLVKTQYDSARQSDINKKEREALAEKERRAGLKDKERWSEHITAMEIVLLKIVPGEFKTAKYQKLAQAFVEQMTEILNGVK